jgi:glycine/D-amino acid oxidase-like deaminating enzyme
MATRRGWDTTLLESGGIGAQGATFYSGGLLRAFDPDAQLVGVAAHGIQAFRQWAELGLPGDCGFMQTGAFYFIAPGRERAAESIAGDLMRGGYPVEFLPKKEVLSRFPAIRDGAWVAAIYEPWGGYGDVRQTAVSLAEGLGEKGHILTGQKVLGIRRVGDSGVVLETAGGKIDADRVVLAAGAGTAAILQASGIKLAEQQWLRARSIGVPCFAIEEPRGVDFPFVGIDEVHETFLRPAGPNRYMVGANLDRWLDADELPPPLTVDHAEDARRRGAHTLDILRAARWQGGVNGYDGYTENRRPIIGAVQDFPALYLAMGFSGRGYKITLAIAAAIVSEFLGGKPDNQMEALCPHRVFDAYRVAPITRAAMPS